MKAAMPVLVSLAGLGVAVVGLWGVAAPAVLTRTLDRWRPLTALPLTVTVRILVGLVFLVAAPECRLPTFVRLVGLLELAGAVTLLALGAGRLARFVEWCVQGPASFVRYWCLSALALGTLLLYAGA